jgi:hypothetical protein
MVVKNLVSGITPLLRAGGEAEKIVLSPLPRYMKKCCRDRSHLTNRKDDDYAAAMGEALEDIRNSMKDLIFGKKIRNFKVLSTTRLFGDNVEETAEKIRSFWKEDPVHMTPEGYSVLVEAIVDVASNAAYNRPTAGLRGKSARGNSTPGQRKRSHWVTEDDILAHRRYKDDKYNKGKRHKWNKFGSGRGGRGSSRGGIRGGQCARGTRGGGQTWRGPRGQGPVRVSCVVGGIVVLV